MADDDIYGSKGKYEAIKAEVLRALNDPNSHPSRARKYNCRNPRNLRHYVRLFSHFESRDLSYIRRVRLLQSMRLVCHLVLRDLADCARDDIDDTVAAMHSIYTTPKSKETFIADLKYFWKLLFPETDEKGRIDDNAVPYVVRHLSRTSDKSRGRLRADKLTPDEFGKVVDYFGGDPRIQAYLTLSLESLARPQELLWRRLRNIELHDNYAKVYLTEHGKEGPGLLQCIDSYPYLLKWLNVHPQKNNPEAFLFVNIGSTGRLNQLRPENINKLLRRACVDLAIQKPVTCYSLKRNGVTMRRLRGESDMEIQHAARWTSTKQLKTYDMSNQEEAFKRELEKRGLIPASNAAALHVKKCEFCCKTSGFGEITCHQCKRPLDRNVIREEVKSRDAEIIDLRKAVADVTDAMRDFKQNVLQDLAEEIRRRGPLLSSSPSRQLPRAAIRTRRVLASVSAERPDSLERMSPRT